MRFDDFSEEIMKHYRIERALRISKDANPVDDISIWIREFLFGKFRPANARYPIAKQPRAACQLPRIAFTNFRS